MKNNKFLKVLAVPMMASALIFTSASPLIGGESAVYAAVNKTQQINQYAKDIIELKKDLEKRLAKLANGAGDGQLVEFISYLDNEYLNSEKIKKEYGDEIAKIHKNLDNQIKPIYDIYSTMLLMNEESSSENGNQEEWERLNEKLDALLGSYEKTVKDADAEFKKEFQNYLKKNGVALDKNLAKEIGITQEDTTVNNSNTVSYKIKKNDTLYSIAKAHNTTVKEIKELNNLKSDTIKEGKTLKIKKNTVTSNTTTNPSTNNSNAKTYTVKKGDNLAKIAKAHGTTVEQLKKSNNLKSDTIHPKQVLKIEKPTTTTKPSTNTNTNTYTYTVKKNDTLYSIAKKNNTTVAKLKKINNLKSDKIVVGEKLKLK